MEPTVAHVPSGLLGKFYGILLGQEGLLDVALAQAPRPTIDVRCDRNVESAATLPANTKTGRKSAYPAALVLPPGLVDTRLRWLGDRNDRAHRDEMYARLGLPADACWEEMVKASYVRFEDHWVAGVAYHH